MTPQHSSDIFIRLFMKYRVFYAFVDSILIGFKNPYEHLKALFVKLQECSVCINFSKSNFGRATLEFLGYHVSKKDIQLLSDKVKCIINFPKLTILMQLLTFLPMLNFNWSFLPKGAYVLSPLMQFSKGCKNRKKKKKSQACLQKMLFRSSKSHLKMYSYEVK